MLCRLAWIICAASLVSGCTGCASEQPAKAPAVSPSAECSAQGGTWTQGQYGGTCSFTSQSWDQENLKKYDHGCPTAIYIAPHGVLEQCV